MRGVVLLCLVVGSVSGQFENLATVDDGSVVYFSTVLRPRGSDHLPYPKLYRFDGNRFDLVAAAEFRTRSVEAGGWIVESASVSGDGRVLGVNSSAPCHYGTPCGVIAQEFSSIYVGQSIMRYKGRAQISRPGRFGLLFRETGIDPYNRPGELPQWGVSLLDLKTGAIARVGDKPARSGRWIAGDGSILAGFPPGNWELAAPSGIRKTLGPAPWASRAVLADDSSFIVYQVSPPHPYLPAPAVSELRIRDRDGGDRLLAAAGAFPSISADSRQILYLAPVDGKLQAFVLGRGAALARQVSFEPEGLAEAVLSGDGDVAVTVTGLGRLLTLNLRTGDLTEHIGITPELEPFPIDVYNEPNPIRGAQVPGSVYSIRGEHLAPGTVRPEPPLPLELDGLRVLVNGQRAALYQVSPEEIIYQVAWETPVRELTYEVPTKPVEVVLRSGDPGWEAVIALGYLPSFLPGAIELGRETVVIGIPIEIPIYAIHGDWRGLVTQSDPARPGEYVYAYARGFGAVEPPVPTGFASPAEPPAMVQRRCDWQGYINVALAPGLVGIYQVTMRIPEDAPSGRFELGCGPYPNFSLVAPVQRP